MLLAYSQPKLAEGFGRVLNELPELSYLVKVILCLHERVAYLVV